jgi:cysteinyl-tRNA synthetase
MSKSLGNFFTVRDLLDQGYPGEVIRFVMLSTHYRSPMDWTAEKARQAEATLKKWYRQASEAIDNADPHTGVVMALSDDLNTSAAIGEIHQLSHANDQPALRSSLRMLGLLGDTIPDWVLADVETLRPFADSLESLRASAMANKDFTAVDKLKAGLVAAGVEVRITKAGVELDAGPEFDPAKLEALK